MEMAVFLLKFLGQAAHLLKQTQIRDQQIDVIIPSYLLDFGLSRLAFRAVATDKNHCRTHVCQFSGRNFANARSATCHQADFALQAALYHF
jgi:hypothetical protein